MTDAPRRPPRAAGAAGEEYAARALARAGWTILDRNARVGRGEIDLVAERRGVIAFVEVKARRRGVAGTPGEAVDPRKRDRFLAAVGGYAARRRLGDAPRVLLVAAVDLDDAGRAVAVRVDPMET